MLPAILAAAQMAQSMDAQNKAQEEQQRQQLGGIYGQQQQAPNLQRFAAQNPDISSLASLFNKKKNPIAADQSPSQGGQIPGYLTMPQ